MALVQCKECKGAVSSHAKKCPHCGINNPAVTFASMAKGLVFIGIVGWILVTCASSDDKTEAAKEPAKTPEQIAAEEAQCRKDLQCWGDKHQVFATSRCKGQVERLAKHSHEWTDEWHETKFSHFRWLDQERGLITYIGDKIKFQNGFGAWTNSVYECDYDPKAETVLAVRAEAGRLN